MINKENGILSKLFEGFDKDEYEKTEAKMVLSSWIDSEIKEQFETKDKFAKAMRKKNSIITRWLSGTQNFTFDTLWDIQKKLNIKILNVERPKTASTYVILHALISKKNTLDKTEELPMHYISQGYSIERSLTNTINLDEEGKSVPNYIPN